MKNEWKAYIICPVRGAEDNKLLGEFVKYLEEENIKCHYPPRDVDQTKDGMYIVREHLKAMLECDVVLVNWKESSFGSHVDLGMSIICASTGKGIVRLNEYECPEHSYGNVLKQLACPAMINTKDDFRNALAKIAGLIAHYEDREKIETHVKEIE